MANANYDSNQEKEFSKLIKNLDAVSCRETYAADFAQRFYDKPVCCTLDPVFLLNSDDYNIIMTSRIINKPYVVVYFPLGVDKKIFFAAKSYARKRQLEIVQISKNPWGNNTIADAGIQEFLSLIYYSDAVFTNSFHAVCFSVLFHKNFYAFYRKTGKKTEDICKRLRVSDHYIVDEFKEKPDIDFDGVDVELNVLRKSSESWIKENILDTALD